MLQILYLIPATVGGVPLFGWGILAWLWMAWCAGLLIYRGIKRDTPTDLAGSLGMAGLVLAMIVFIAPNIMEKDAAGVPQGIAIRGYGVMLLSGIVGGVGLTLYRAKRAGLSADVIYSLALWVFVAGMIGARAFYVIEYWPQFQRPTLGETLGSVVNMTRGGLVVFGGLIGAVGALLLFTRKHNLPVLPLADLVAPGMMLGLALGRVGCFFNGCCFGDLCTLPWSVEFPLMSPPHMRQIENGRLFGFTLKDPTEPLTDAQSTVPGMRRPRVASVEVDSPAERAGLQVGDLVLRINDRPLASADEAQEILLTAVRDGQLPLRIDAAGKSYVVELPARLQTHSRPVHPVQIYSAIDALLLTLLLLAFEPLRRRDGETFALFLGVHGISRFLLETIRIDEGAVFGTGLSISQNISVVMLLGAVGLWIYASRRPPQTAWPAAVAAG